MNLLIHLCKKDFAFAKPWILGTWLACAIGSVLPWISPDGREGEPFMMIRLLAPAVMVFLASTKIIFCDPFVGTSRFMGTRPVRATRLLTQKLILIAVVLVLPAVALALLHAACLRVQLSGSDCLLLFIENWLYFSLIAGTAVVYAVISRHIGILVVFILATPPLFLMLLALFHLNRPFGKLLEDQHLSASFQLVAQAFLSVAAIAIALSWAAKRRVWLTAAGFLLGAAFLIAPGMFWKWNFVEELSKDATAAEIVSDSADILWTDAPKFGSNSSRDNITYSQVTRPGRLTGLKDGWMGKLVKFQSEARFKDGTVWNSKSDPEYDASGDLAPAILPQLGIDIVGKQFAMVREDTNAWTLFECKRNRLRDIPDRRASIRGVGTFQLDRPVILAELPAQVGATAVCGRFKYRIDRMDTTRTAIHMNLSLRGVTLASLGDGAKELYRTEFLLVNPATGEFTTTESGGSSRTGNEWCNLHQTFSINEEPGSAKRPNAKEFLKGARLYILGTRYGGTIKLPFEVPEMELEGDDFLNKKEREQIGK